MKANPGGSIAPQNVVGRDQLIEQIWTTLEGQSVILTAERRIGKTSVIKKMQAEPKAGWYPVFQDLESLHSPEEFALVVYEKVQNFLGLWKRVANSAQKFLQDHRIEAAGVALESHGTRHWKAFLERSIEDLTNARGQQQLVFFWDEFPYMLDNIWQREGSKAVGELLDTLRALRQSQPSFRMVLTGSIGLHHIMARLKAEGYRNAPFNDMLKIEVPPLDLPDAQQLAQRLIEGEQLICPDKDLATAAIAFLVDGFPYYIHHIVRELKNRRHAADPARVLEIIEYYTRDASDPWNLTHYRDRIADYYPNPDDATAVRLILDTLASQTGPIPLAQLMAELQSQTALLSSRDRVLPLLRLLELDHYIMHYPDGTYAFRFSLIERWWKHDRDL
ncbi:MAG: hypothetical protein V4719_28795 [Planctomycetota bacterium]